MKLNKFKILIIICSLIAAEGAFAQKIRIINLEEAISTAVKNNSDLVNARLDNLKAMRLVSETYSENLVPTITLNSRYNRSFKKQVFDIFGEKIEIGTDNSITNSIDVTESIPVLGTPVFQGIRIAEYYERMSGENVKRIESNIKTDVKKAYFSVLFARQIAGVKEKSLINSQDNLKVVETKYRNGAATEFDYLRAKVRVETIKPDYDKSLNDLELSKKNLKNIMGLKLDEEIDVTGSLVYDSTEVFGNINDVISRIVEKNVLIRQLKINRNINEEIVRVDKANYLPKLYLFGQYQLTASENDGKSLFRYRYYNIINAGIGLTWDLNLFKNSYKVDQSELEVRKSDETILDTQRKLKIQTESVWLKMDDARKRIIAQHENVKLAERSYELASISFKEGMIKQIDVLDAEFMLDQVRLAYLQAIFDYLSSKSEMEGLLEK
jgi:outer membrane protein TolC